jgi:ribosome-associated translation inhibitor RaiA
MTDEMARPSHPMTVMTRGAVADESIAYAIKRLASLIGHIAEPVLLARVKLTEAPHRTPGQPAIAEVTVDINGDVVRAQLGADSMGEAIDLLAARLRRRLEHRARRRPRHRGAHDRCGEWRHGDPPTERPEYFDRPPEERELVRHKSYPIDWLTPDEAAVDMEQRDFDFYLFRDRVSGGDALLERRSDGSYRLTQLRTSATTEAPNTLTVQHAEHAAPTLELDEAIERIGVDGERFVFFADPTTGRGNVLYRRYDGHYGLIAPD